MGELEARRPLEVRLPKIALKEMLVRWQAARLQCVLCIIEDENTDGDQDEHSWQWLCWQYHSGGDIVNIGKMATNCNVVKMDAFFAMCNG